MYIALLKVLKFNTMFCFITYKHVILIHIQIYNVLSNNQNFCENIFSCNLFLLVKVYYTNNLSE